MAVRFIALLIPLAILLPQLQTSRVAAPEPRQPAPLAQPAADAEWSLETRHIADAAPSRVAVESPLHDAVRMLDGAATDPVVVATAPAVLTVVPAHVRQATPKRATPRLARAASPVKLVSAAPAPGRSATRGAKRRPADAGCLPGAHCAPVVVAKVTPVNRRPL